MADALQEYQIEIIKKWRQNSDPPADKNGHEMKYVGQAQPMKEILESFKSFVGIRHNKTKHDCRFKVITGAPGIGKSRFLLELKNYFRKKLDPVMKDVQVLIVRYTGDLTPFDIECPVAAFVLRLMYFEIDVDMSCGSFQEYYRIMSDKFGQELLEQMALPRLMALLKPTNSQTNSQPNSQTNSPILLGIDDLMIQESSGATMILLDILCAMIQFPVFTVLADANARDLFDLIILKCGVSYDTIKLNLLDYDSLLEIAKDLSLFKEEDLDSRKTRDFRRCLLTFSGLPILANSFFQECRKHLMTSQFSLDEITENVKEQFLRPVRRGLVLDKLIVNSFLEAGINRECRIDWSVPEAAVTYGELEKRQELILIETDHACVKLQMPFLLLRHLVMNVDFGSSLPHKLSAAMRNIFATSEKGFIPEYLATYEMIRTSCIFHQRKLCHDESRSCQLVNLFPGVSNDNVYFLYETVIVQEMKLSRLHNGDTSDVDISQPDTVYVPDPTKNLFYDSFSIRMMSEQEESARQGPRRSLIIFGKMHLEQNLTKQTIIEAVRNIDNIAPVNFRHIVVFYSFCKSPFEGSQDEIPKNCILICSENLKKYCGPALFGTLVYLNSLG